MHCNYGYISVFQICMIGVIRQKFKNLKSSLCKSTSASTSRDFQSQIGTFSSREFAEIHEYILKRLSRIFISAEIEASFSSRSQFSAFTLVKIPSYTYSQFNLLFRFCFSLSLSGNTRGKRHNVWCSSF